MAQKLSLQKKKKKSCEPFEVKICCANKGIQVIITEKKMSVMKVN